jgi:PAS domain S-box-containing protein
MFGETQISFDVIGVATAFVAVIAFLYRSVFRPAFKNLSKLFDSLEKIDVIYNQMFTNGGSTLRDAVNRIENRITLVEKKQGVYMMDTAEGVYETNASGEFTSVNRTMCKFLGRIESDLLGNGWLNSVSEEDRYRVDEAWDYAIKNQIEFEMSFDVVDSDKEIHSVKCRAKPIRSSDGNLIGYIGIVDYIKRDQ